MNSALQQLRQHGIEIRHYIPGRLRFSVRELARDQVLAQRIQMTLQQVPGVTKVEYHPATTSVLVLFDRGQFTQPGNIEHLLTVLNGIFPAVGIDVWRGLWAAGA